MRKEAEPQLIRFDLFFFFFFKSVLVLLELVVKREGSSDGDGAVRRRQ